MRRSLSSPSLLAMALTVALPAFAQSHAGHDMPTPAPAPAPKTKQPTAEDAVDHSKMDHSTMDHSQMDHAAMGHGTSAPTEPREPIPVPTDADRAAAFPPIAHGAMEHAPEINSLLLIDRLEHWDGKNSNGQAWEATGWIGGNINRLWLRTDGERSDGRTESSAVEALYGRSVSP